MKEKNCLGVRAPFSPAKQLLLQKRLQGEARNAALNPGIIPRAPRSGSAPLSFAQQRLWFLDQLAPGSPVYNISEGLHLKGLLDVPALEQSLKEVIRRHEAVRTNFRAVDGQAAQFISPAAELKMEKVDLSRLSDREREAEFGRRMLAEAEKPFDLTTDLMLRATLVQLEAKEHVLLVTMHHIASDAWSMGVLYRELSALYGAFTKGLSPFLPELSIQYQDFAVWQRQWLQGPVLEKQLAYWKNQLANAPDSLALPFDHPRSEVQTFRGARHWRTFPESLARKIKDLSRREGATLFMTLLAAFQALLHRYSRQTDILIGSPNAGRTQMETEDLIGFFINTLVLRADLSGDPSFSEMLAKARQVTLDAYACQDLPFEKLVMELRPGRSSNQTPLFQVMFVLQNAPAHGLDLGGVTATPREVYNGTAKFDLILIAMETEGGLLTGFEYNRDLFDAATIERMLGHYQTLLEAVAADATRRLSDLPILSEPERTRLLVQWNETQTDYPRGKTIPQIFEEQAERTPEATALAYGEEFLNYRQLNVRANQVANYLAKAGVGAEAKVALCLDRSLELVPALLGILKAGAAYVSIDPASPAERLLSMLEDAQPAVLLTTEKLLAELPKLPLSPVQPSAASVPAMDKAASPAKSGFVTICLDRDWKAICLEPGANLPPAATPESLAYVSFTSGSTGRPKGVCIPHRGVVRLVKATNYTTIESSDVFLQLAPISFDASTFEIWGALLNGARLVVAPPAMPSLGDLGELILKSGVTKLWLTSGLFNEMVDHQLPSLRKLNQLLAGGDVLSVPHVRKALEILEGCQLVNGYGPTENTTFTSCHLISAESIKSGSIPIGRPISNTRVYVLDERLQPVPVGVPGELHLAGDGLAEGYLGRPELTAEKFVPNPFSSEPGGRLYKTGDLARYLQDGSLEFLGRIDRQVKVRGFRVELGEIETMLGQHPAIRQCVLTARPTQSGQKQLVAYFVATQKPPAAGELRQYLRGKLPEYMLPAFFVPLPALPLTPGGKVDHSALPAPQPSKGDPDLRQTAPRDVIEVQLTKIWEAVLGIHPIGVTDQFFELGGHSLLAVRLLAQIEKAFGKKLSVAAVFQAPTIEQLAGILREGRSTVPSSSLVEIQPRGSKPPLLLVHGVGGGMFWGYTNLSRHLGFDQPVYALRSRALAGQEEFDRIEEMAAQYVADLRAFQPQGPYHLGGYCFGGNVAYEMAQQLRAQGQTVAFLGLINAGPPNSSYGRISWTPLFVLKFLRNLCFWPGYVMTWTPEQRRGFFRWKARLATKKLKRLFSRTRSASTQVDVENLVDLSMYPEEQRKLWEIHIRALINYCPKPYVGGITLFRSRGHPLLCSFDSKYGWGELARGGVAVKVISGPHESILEEPYVRTLAIQLKKCLERAQTTGSGFPDAADEHC